MIAIHGEAYGNALTVYGNIKFLAKKKQPGAQAAYDELSVRFPGSTNAGRKNKGYGPSYAA